MKKTISAAFALVAVTLALGCAETQEVAQAPVAAPEPKVLPGLSPTERLRRGLALLEDGDEATARAEIALYQSRTTNSSLARSLMRQIDLPPDKYFPPEYREVILRKGQSLSNIAETYLGSAIEFHALAKYNGIAQPRRMFPGQIVKVPLTSEAREAFADLADALDEPSLASVPLAESLSNSPEPLEAPSDAIDSDESTEEIDASPEPDLVPAVTSATANNVEPQKAASEQVAEAAQDSDDTAADPVAMQATEEAIAEGAMETAAQEPAKSSMADAPDVEVVALTSPPVEPAAVDVDALHRRAINAYRAQDLDTAISLWDEVLEADPSYEGARLYRSQALALRKRLNSFK